MTVRTRYRRTWDVRGSGPPRASRNGSSASRPKKLRKKAIWLVGTLADP